MSSMGGMPAPLGLELIPITNLFNTALYYFNTQVFNDPNVASSYSYKVEQVLDGRVPTVRRIIVSYRDLGQATLTVTISGVTSTTDANNPITPFSKSSSVKIGTVGATQKIGTIIIGVGVSGTNLQLSVSRAANGGPVSITKVRIEGTVEKTSY